MLSFVIEPSVGVEPGTTVAVGVPVTVVAMNRLGQDYVLAQSLAVTSDVWLQIDGNPPVEGNCAVLVDNGSSVQLLVDTPLGPGETTHVWTTIGLDDFVGAATFVSTLVDPPSSQLWPATVTLLPFDTTVWPATNLPFVAENSYSVTRISKTGMVLETLNYVETVLDLGGTPFSSTVLQNTAGNAWLYVTDPSADRIVRLRVDAATGSVSCDRTLSTRSQPRGCCSIVAEKKIAVANYGDNSLTLWSWNEYLDTYSEQTVAVDGGPLRVIATPTCLFVLSHKLPIITVLELDSYAVIVGSRTVVYDTAPCWAWDMTWDGTNLYVTNSARCSITVVDPQTSTVGSVPWLGLMPSSILWLDNFFYVTDYEQSKLYVLENTITSVPTSVVDLPRVPFSVVADPNNNSLLVLSLYGNLPSRVAYRDYRATLSADLGQIVGADRNTTYHSPSVTVGGLVNTTVAASCSVPNYSVELIKNGMVVDGNTTTAQFGDVFSLVITSSDLFDTDRYAWLVVGNAYSKFSVVTRKQPLLANFLFEPVVDSATATTHTTPTHMVRGMLPGETATFEVGGSVIGWTSFAATATVIINGTPMSGSGPFVLENSTRIALTGTSSSIPGETVFHTLTVGEYVAHFPITTVLATHFDLTPHHLTVFEKLGQPPGLLVVSEPVLISGVTAPTRVSIPPTYQAALLRNGVDVGTSADFSTGDRLAVRLTTLPLYDFDHWLPVCCAGITTNWHVRTGIMGSGGGGGGYKILPFKFFPVWGVLVGSHVESNEIVVLGIPVGVSVYAYLPIGSLVVNGVASPYVGHGSSSAGTVMLVQAGDRIKIGVQVEPPWGATNSYQLLIENTTGNFEVNTATLSPIASNYELHQEQPSTGDNVPRGVEKMWHHYFATGDQYFLSLTAKAVLAATASAALATRQRSVAGPQAAALAQRCHSTTVPQAISASLPKQLANFGSTRGNFRLQVSGDRVPARGPRNRPSSNVQFVRYLARLTGSVGPNSVRVAKIYQASVAPHGIRLLPTTRPVVAMAALRNTSGNMHSNTPNWKYRHNRLFFSYLQGIRTQTYSKVANAFAGWLRCHRTAHLYVPDAVRGFRRLSVANLSFLLAGKIWLRHNKLSWRMWQGTPNLLGRVTRVVRTKNLARNISSTLFFAKNLFYFRNRTSLVLKHFAYLKYAREWRYTVRECLARNKQLRVSSRMILCKFFAKYRLGAPPQWECWHANPLVVGGNLPKAANLSLRVLALLLYKDADRTRRLFVGTVWSPAARPINTVATEWRRDDRVSRRLAGEWLRDVRLNRRLASELLRNVRLWRRVAPELVRDVRLWRRMGVEWVRDERAKRKISPELVRDERAIRKIEPELIRNNRHVLLRRMEIVRNFARVWEYPENCDDPQSGYFQTEQLALADASARGWPSDAVQSFQTAAGCWGYVLLEIPGVWCSYNYPKGYITGG